jgi:predicted secreted protein
LLKRCSPFRTSATPIRSSLSGPFRALLGFAAALALAAPAVASDAAESVAIGYSGDSRYFAFEEFGIQDGSGSAYANIYVIDLKANSWAPGTPVRVGGGDDEGPKLSAVRAEAAAKAAPVLKKLAISEAPQLLAAGPATQPSDDRSRLQFDRWYRHLGGAVPLPVADIWDERYELSAVPRDVLPLPAECEDLGEPVRKLAVHLKRLKAGSDAIVYQDDALPKSRGCAYAYDIDKVFIPADYDAPEAPVALIGVYTRGFEGFDRRYIAIPFDLSQ